jgi:hypothetical protein
MGTEDRDTRHGYTSGTGANEAKRDEPKEQRPDWKPRQGGDQTRGDEDRLNPPIAGGPQEGPLGRRPSPRGFQSTTVWLCSRMNCAT